MRIKNKENNKNTIYIQEKDLDQILKTETDIPTPLLNALKRFSEQTSPETSENFVQIKNEEVINYLESKSYILDYREIKYLTEEEIESRIASLKEQKTTLEELSQLSHPKLAQTNYEIDELTSYLNKRKNASIIDLPLTIDSEELHISVKEANCIIGLSLNKTKILFKRLDNKPFSEKDNLPVSLVQAAIIEFGPALAIPIQQTGMLEVNAKFTENGEFFVAEYEYTPLTQNQISDRFPMLSQPTRIKRKENQKRKTLLEKYLRKKDVEQ